jgi:hypothetical protein
MGLTSKAIIQLLIYMTYKVRHAAVHISPQPVYTWHTMHMRVRNLYMNEGATIHTHIVTSTHIHTYKTTTSQVSSKVPR